MSDGEDFMTRLPAEISLHILSVLDAESLLACAAVNRAWDEMTNRLPPDVWCEACLEAGISVDPDKYQDAREWKVFLSSMTRRLRDMKTGKSYQARYSQIYEERIRAIYCRNEKIAIAYGDCVDILDALDEDYYVKFECKIDVSLLKFDDNILVAASSSGYISTWSIPLESCIKYCFIAGIAIMYDFDFFADYSIMASSILDESFSSSIYLWSMDISDYSTVHRIDIGGNLIFRLIVAPFRDQSIADHQKVFFLFGLCNDCVLGWRVELTENPVRATRVLKLNSLRIPPSPDVHKYGLGLTPYGLLFDGEELYITAPSPGSSPYIIWVWNHVQDTLYRVKSRGEILNLLGVGEKYLVYSARNKDYDAVYAVDKYSNKLITRIRGPRISEDFIFLGHTSWLDGLNGENDRGIVYAATMDEETQLIAVKFAPRTE